MNMKTCCNATVFLSKYTIPHKWSRDLRANQTCYTKQKYGTCIFRFACLFANWSSSFTVEITKCISHRLIAACLSGWVK
jgi:hypothetical protein